MKTHKPLTEGKYKNSQTKPPPTRPKSSVAPPPAALPRRGRLINPSFCIVCGTNLIFGFICDDCYSGNY